MPIIRAHAQPVAVLAFLDRHAAGHALNVSAREAVARDKPTFCD